MKDVGLFRADTDCPFCEHGQFVRIGSPRTEFGISVYDGECDGCGATDTEAAI